PQTAYDYLYPEAPSQPMLNIGHVTESAPKGIDDIVVPLAPPMMLTAAEFPGLEDPAMLDHPRILQVMPSMNLV
ncbi:hypothetical protein GN156_34700, partial [bacterium LRH843]|nr:hypothetical protein [bacterium LRH843]